MKWSAILTLLCIFGLAGSLFAGVDPSSGEIDNGVSSNLPAIAVPAGFNPAAAEAAMKQARRDGNAAKAAELGSQLNAWWLEHRTINSNPAATGYDPNPNPGPQTEETKADQPPQYNWGTDSRISAYTNIYGVDIASLTNGELYAFSVYYDGSAYHGVINRSINNGLSWTTYWDNTFATTTTIIDPSIIVIQDTLVYSYILYHPADGTYRTWVKVCLPGTTDTPIYYGSPTGNFNAVRYNDFRICSDNAAYANNEYLYATWTETYGTTPDSTRTGFARSNELNVGTWEITPQRIDYSNGGAYWFGSRIAFGSSTADHLWIVTALHPNLYPSSYDRCVTGYMSADFGATWGSAVYITTYSDDLDQWSPTIAGAHSNVNWVVLYNQNDTSSLTNRDVYLGYSTNDGTNWNLTSWIVPYTEFGADVWVDDASTAFYSSVRQDVTTGNELAKYKMAPISNPSNWTGSVTVNNNIADLSASYMPTVTRNRGTGDAVIAWTDFSSGYSIWMDAESWTGIEEGSDTKVLTTLSLNISPNPNRGVSRLDYAIRRDGNVRIAVYDATGRLINNLVNETRKAGLHTASLNVNLPNGVYFVRMDTPDGNVSKTLTVVR